MKIRQRLTPTFRLLAISGLLTVTLIFKSDASYRCTNNGKLDLKQYLEEMRQHDQNSQNHILKFVPKDVKIISGPNNYITVNNIDVRILPDGESHSLFSFGDSRKFSALCQVVAADGSGWYVVYTAGGYLNYVDALQVESVVPHKPTSSK